MNTSTSTRKTVPTICTSIIGDALHLRFADDSSITITPGDLDEATRYACLMHGLKQKLVDAAALSKGASLDEKYEAVMEVATRLRAGEWNKKREAGGEGVNGGLLFRALCELSPKNSPDAIRAFLADKSPEQKALLRAVPRIAGIIDQLRAAKANVNVEEGEILLAGLDLA